MRWATRPGVHIDRAASAWLIRRFIDPQAEFEFYSRVELVPAGVSAFDMPGADDSHHGGDCTFETLLRRFDLADPVLWRLAQSVHEADLEDGRFDAPEAPGLDMVLRGLTLSGTDTHTLAVAAAIFDGLLAYHRRALLTGRDPA